MVIKLNHSNNYVSAITQLLLDKGVLPGDKVSFAFKKGKRWKLKAFRVENYGSRHCDDCGHYAFAHFSRGGGKTHFCIDAHLGLASLSCPL